jgi:hypothetical protein
LYHSYYKFNWPMNKRSILFYLGLVLNLNVFSQTNLIEDWNGNGDVNITTSYPDNYGWDVTVGEFNYANSSGGVRWYDVTSGHTLDGSDYTGRLLMVRWDGSGSTSLESVYSYPVTLEANKKYLFQWIYEWWNNASAPVLTIGIGTDKTGDGLVALKDFTCSGTRQLLQEGEMSFFITEGDSYFLTIRANNLAALCGIGELSIVEVESLLECSVSSIALNYYEAEKTFTIFPNGSDIAIDIIAPQGIILSTSSLLFTGGEVTVSSRDSSNVSGNITITQGPDTVLIPVTSNFPDDFFKLVRIDTLTPDGAWCWFNDPRALYYKGIKEQTYISWVNSSGNIMIAAYNHETGIYTEKVLFPELEVDDHDNPAIFIRKDRRLVVYFSKHTTAPAHRFISTNPEDISSWGEDYRFGENVTYPYPFQVGDSIYIFYRGINWHPTLIISGDDGETMGTPQQVITGGGDRPYARYCQDKTGAIHIAFTTTHPRDDPNNKIYYALFKEGKFYKADGTYIKDFTSTETALNIDLNEAETVYAATQGKGWIWDIVVDVNNHPVMVFASFPSDTDHRYHYARWTGTEWYQTEMTHAGKWFPQTVSGGSESEPNYSGGIILDYDDPSVVYLSRQVKGVFEIFRFTTPDEGMTWDSTALTWDTPGDIVNVRPIVPRHHRKGIFDLVWMRGSYVHYNNYNTSLVFWSDTAVNEVDSIFFREDTVALTKGMSNQLSVSFVPFITSGRSLSWSSSNEDICQVNNGHITGINTGTATITATVFNGKSAACVVNVNPPTYLTSALFDFGTSTSPVASGAMQVTGSTLFENSYGWTSPVSTRDRGSGWSDELRDFCFSSSSALFRVSVMPGKYHITAKQGDLGYPHDMMNIYVNDSLKSSSVSTTAGNYSSGEFDVDIDGEIMELKFEDGGGTDANWVINSLKLEATPVQPPGLNVAENTIPEMTARLGESDTVTISLSATGLLSDIFLSITGADAGEFTVTPAVIVRPETGILPVTEVSIVYHPDLQGDHTAALNIHSEGADDLSFTLNGLINTTGIRSLDTPVIVYSEPGKLVVSGANSFLVYNIMGVPVAEITGHSNRSVVNLKPGIYLVKTGNNVYKVVVQ